MVHFLVVFVLQCLLFVRNSDLVFIIIIIIIIELTHSKTILGSTVEIEPQPIALDFKNLDQYSSRSK